MKQMLGTLGATFDTLGEQTVKVATLPAAMEAVSQVSIRSLSPSRLSSIPPLLHPPFDLQLHLQT